MRIPFITLAVSAAAFSHAGIILGLDDSALYKIDVSTGASTLVGSLTGSGSGDTNALAYDGATNIAYFQRGGKLWTMDAKSGKLGGGTIAVGNVAAATFYGGRYVYGTGSALMAVNPSTATTTTLGTFDKGWGFGDIATTPAGMLYGSAGGSVFRIDLSDDAYTALSASGKSLQLGFVGTTLYGVANGNAGLPTGSLYTVSTTTGVESGTGLTATYGGAALAIRDAATFNPVPEPASLAALGVGVLSLQRRRK